MIQVAFHRLSTRACPGSADSRSSRCRTIVCQLHLNERGVHVHAPTLTLTRAHSRSLALTRSLARSLTRSFVRSPTKARGGFWDANPSFEGLSSSDDPTDNKNGLPDYDLKVGKLPDYSLPNYRIGVGQAPKNLPSYRDGGARGQRKGLGKKAWWRYQIPSASSFSGQLSEVRENISPNAVPGYGGGDNGKGGGGWGGRWGGRGDGGGDEPMKGWTYAFALIVVAGGIAAYVRKGSTQSLIVSSGVAVLLLIAASLMGVPTSKVGTILALATAICLAALMGIKAKNTRKVVPAAVTVYSAAMACGYIVTLL